MLFLEKIIRNTKVTKHKVAYIPDAIYRSVMASLSEGEIHSRRCVSVFRIIGVTFLNSSAIPRTATLQSSNIFDCCRVFRLQFLHEAVIRPSLLSSFKPRSCPAFPLPLWLHTCNNCTCCSNCQQIIVAVTHGVHRNGKICGGKSGATRWAGDQLTARRSNRVA